MKGYYSKTQQPQNCSLVKKKSLSEFSSTMQCKLFTPTSKISDDSCDVSHLQSLLLTFLLVTLHKFHDSVDVFCHTPPLPLFLMEFLFHQQS